MLVARKSAQSTRGRGTRGPGIAVMKAYEQSATRFLRDAHSLTVGAINTARRLSPNPAGDLANRSIMHEVFGHESIANPWIDSLMFLDTRTQGQPAIDSVRIIGA